MSKEKVKSSKTGIIGFIAIVILAVCAWQLSVKPQSEAAAKYKWPLVVKNLSASADCTAGTISASWMETMMGNPFKLEGYQIIVTPQGKPAETYDLNLSQTTSRLATGATYPTRSVTLQNADAATAPSVKVKVSPVISHPVLYATAAPVTAAGKSVNATLKKKTPPCPTCGLSGWLEPKCSGACTGKDKGKKCQWVTDGSVCGCI